jgi:hypothetical protein
MGKAVFGESVGVYLNTAEVNALREKGYYDFDFFNINGTLRISVTNREIPPRNGCESEIDVRRYPEQISPYEYKGKQLWVFRISKTKFEKFIGSALDDDGTRCLMSRCKYDRIHIGYFSD